MIIDDILLCTFEGDIGTPPTDFVAEITQIDTFNNTFDCRLVDTGQQMTFNYSGEPWEGTDPNGNRYVLASHYIYTAGKVDPIPQDAAVVTFADNNRYLCYVDNVDPSIDVTFYHYPYSELSFENNMVIKSDWDAYPVGSSILSIEGYFINADLPHSDTPATEFESKPPYLFVDAYHRDLNGKPDWDVLANTPKFFGAIIKCSESLQYNDRGWFKKNWPAVKTAGGDRYGKTWFRGAYHFLKFNKDGAEQADYYLSNVEAAGGWDRGDIIPIIDVELGNDGSKNPSRRNSNRDASAQQIIDCTSACAERLRSQTGRRVMLYGRGAMRDKRIKSRMSCDIVWNPSYTAKMVRHGLEAWELNDIALWQYCGDGVAAFDASKLPRAIPNFGKVDISVYIDGANKPTYESLITRLGIGT